MDLSCNNVMSWLGWRCKVLHEYDPSVIYVSSPITLAGGSPLDFFLKPGRGLVHFTDDGLTLHQLRGLGYRLDEGRSTRGIAAIAEEAGFELQTDGAIVGIGRASQGAEFGRRVIHLFHKLVEWEAEHFESRDSDQTLMDEVARLMTAKAPLLQLVQFPKVALRGGDEVEFMFQWGHKLVDAIAPDARSTSSRMRKAIQVTRNVDDDLDMLIIVDDRAKPEKASKEVALLGQVTQAIRLTHFEEFYEREPQIV